MNILIVDDNKTNRKLLRIVLEADGAQTVEAANGVQALAVLEREKVDVIVSDILMPNMDGYRLSHAIRDSEKFANVPLIIYSGTYTSAAEAKLALEFGADKFIAKPCPNQVMLEAVREVARDGRPRRSTQADAAEELAVMKRYSEVLVRKLEEKNASLEFAQTQLIRSNHELMERTDELERVKAELEKKVAELERRPGR